MRILATLILSVKLFLRQFGLSWLCLHPQMPEGFGSDEFCSGAYLLIKFVFLKIMDSGCGLAAIKKRCGLSTHWVVRLCPVKGPVTQGLRPVSPCQCRQPAPAGAAVKTFGVLPFASMILTFQSGGLRKHPPVGLNDLLPT